MALNPGLLIAAKEIRENLRDRRAVLSSLVWGPLLGPVLVALMIGFSAAKEINRAQETLKLPVVGAEHAPGLVDFLRRQGVEMPTPPEDPEAAVLDEQYDVVLRIGPDFPAAWRAGRPAPVEIIADESRRDAATPVQRTRLLLQSWGAQVAQGRLLLRGLDPGLTQPLAVRTRDLSTPSSRGAMVLAIMPYFILITVFVGGMYLAIDATAGEKERQSLEPLLINPLPRWQVMGGKLLATFLFSCLTLTIALVAFHIAMGWVPTERMNLSLELGWPTLARIFILTVPLALVASALQTIIAAFANSYREAQTYLSFLVIIPLVPSITLLLAPMKTELWALAIPLLSHNLIILDLLRGKQPDGLEMALVIFSTLVVGLLLSLLAAGLYNRTRLIFSRG